MSPLPTLPADRRRERRTLARLERLTERLEADERALVQLRNTVDALARETAGITVCHPCDRCEQSLMLLREGTMYCPHCHYRRTM